jgi:hypothetical protein
VITLLKDSWLKSLIAECILGSIFAYSSKINVQLFGMAACISALQAPEQEW